MSEGYPADLNPFRSSRSSSGPWWEASSNAGSAFDEGDDLPLPPPPQDWISPVFLPPPQLPVVADVAYSRPTPTVHLPTFRAERPAAWFAQCQELCRMRGITDQRELFALCHAMLGGDQLRQVDDIAEMLPRPPDAFFRMRDRLVASHSLDEFQRLEQLIALPALGGQRPSALLAEMSQLCPHGEEHTKIFRALFLQRLPQPVRLQLAEDKHSPVTALAARADTLMAHHAFGAAAVSVPGAVENQDPLVAAVRDAGRQDWRDKKKKNKGKSKPAAAAADKPWAALGICKFHYRYGQECYNCADPSSCKWGAGN